SPALTLKGAHGRRYLAEPRERAIGSVFCCASWAGGPRGRRKLDCAPIPPFLRQETKCQVPRRVFEAGADPERPDQVVDEPLVLDFAAGRSVLPPSSASAPSRITLPVPVA